MIKYLLDFKKGMIKYIYVYFMKCLPQRFKEDKFYGRKKLSYLNWQNSIKHR